MTKTEVLTALAGGEDVAACHMIPGDQHPIEHTCHQWSLLCEDGGLHAGVHTRAERLPRGGQACGVVETRRLLVQWFRLPDQSGLARLQVSAATLGLGHRHHAAQVRFRHAIKWLLSTDWAAAQGGTSGRQLLRQPRAGMGARQRLGDDLGMAPQFGPIRRVLARGPAPSGVGLSHASSRVPRINRQSSSQTPGQGEHRSPRRPRT